VHIVHKARGTHFLPAQVPESTGSLPFTERAVAAALLCSAQEQSPYLLVMRFGIPALQNPVLLSTGAFAADLHSSTNLPAPWDVSCLLLEADRCGKALAEAHY
jgi:hypothetical protein